LDALASDPPEGMADRLRRLSADARTAAALLTPIRVLLMGPPNVGKSTLMNALLRRERVIVHHRPGTTRDVVRETVAVRGLPMELVDTAGLRTAPGKVERRAVARAAELVATCDVALVLFDARRRPAWIEDRLDDLRIVPRVVLVGNKVDLLSGPPRPFPPPAQLRDAPRVFIAARQGTGIEQVEEALLRPHMEAMDRIARGVGVPFTPELAKAVAEIAETLAVGGRMEAVEELDRRS
jgi:tRNA modification GTPase